MRVALLGAAGKLGTVLASALEAEPDLDLVARVEHSTPLSVIREAQTEVALDVTTAVAGRENLRWLASAGIDSVVGTTGFNADDLAAFSKAFSETSTRCLLVPNFAIGAVMLMRLAEQATPHFDNVEILELHHPQKKDAPSGTSRSTAERIAAARQSPWGPDATESETAIGARGGEVAGVRVHSVRLPGVIASEEVMFGAAGQTFSLRHDTFDRTAFVPGALLALRSIRKLPPGLTIGLDAVL